MGRFENGEQSAAVKIWVPARARTSSIRDLTHSQLRGIAIGIVAGLAIGFAATAETGHPALDASADAASYVEVRRLPEQAESKASYAIEALRDSAHIMRIKARGAISRGALAEAESYLDEAGELDPEAPMLPVLRRLIDLSKSRLEMG